jgi:hypothetical protein
MGELSSHKRMQFRRHLRILEKEANAKHQTLIGENTETAVNNFILFYRDKKEDRNEDFLAFLKAVVCRCKEKNWIQIDTMLSDGRTIASLLHFKYQNKYYEYSMVTDKKFNPKVSVGNALVGVCISKAIKEGAIIYDFLKGSEEYKFSWANEGARSVNLYFCNRGIRPIVHFLGEAAKNVVKVMFR